MKLSRQKTNESPISTYKRNQQQCTQNQFGSLNDWMWILISTFDPDVGITINYPLFSSRFCYSFAFFSSTVLHALALVLSPSLLSSRADHILPCCTVLCALFSELLFFLHSQLPPPLACSMRVFMCVFLCYFRHRSIPLHQFTCALWISNEWYQVVVPFSRPLRLIFCFRYRFNCVAHSILRIENFLLSTSNKTFFLRSSLFCSISIIYLDKWLYYVNFFRISRLILSSWHLCSALFCIIEKWLKKK